jgi:hypothetical protein
VRALAALAASAVPEVPAGMAGKPGWSAIIPDHTGTVLEAQAMEATAGLVAPVAEAREETVAQVTVFLCIRTAMPGLLPMKLPTPLPLQQARQERAAQVAPRPLMRALLAPAALSWPVITSERAYFFARNSVTFATMFSAVNPNFAATALAGPDSPNCSMVI